MLLIVALLLFAAAAVLGLILAGMYFRQEKLLLGLAVPHGVLAAAGLIALLIAVIMGKTSSLGATALIIFAAAALGGFTLLVNHLTQYRLPRLLVAAHAIAAVLAFLILLFGGFKA